jgi:type I restriction enzyme S subunit
MNKKLEEIATILSGKDYKGNPPGDDVPIYGTGGIMGYTSIPLYHGESVLSGRKGSINNPYYVDGDFWNVDTIFCIKAKEGVNTKWLYYNFKNTDLYQLNEATGVPSVNSKALYRLKFNWFEYPEQRQIAKILTTADAVIEKTQAAIDKYKAIKQGMLHDLFTRGIDISTGKLRPKYEEAPELYKESKLGMIPKEWDVKPLEDIAVIHNGIDYKRNPPGQEIPIYGTGGIMGFTSISLNNGPAVLTGRKGSINRPIYVEGEFWNVDTIFCLKPKDKINTKWLYYNILLTDMNKYNEATGVPSIASKTLYKLNFCHYDIEEQNKIIEFITPIENTLQAEESSLLKLKQLKTGLMGDLLSGKKRVTIKEEMAKN